MPNLVKYSTTNIANTQRKGNVLIAGKPVDYGATYWTGIFEPENGYTIYTLPSNSNSPSIVQASNDTDLIYWATALGGSNILTAVDALTYLCGLSNTIVMNRSGYNITTDGLVLDYETNFTLSYPRGNSTFYDIAGGSNNGSLVNGITFASGATTFDGTDDYVNFTAPNLSSVASVEMVCKITSGFDGKMFMGWLYYDVYCAYSSVGYNTGNSDVYGINSTQVTSLGLVNNWKHYIFEMRSDVPYTNNKIYVNGVSQTLSQVGSTEASSNRSFNSGSGRIASWGGGGYNMPMDLVLFRVYNKSLSQDEVNQNLYQGNIVTSNLSHLWDASNFVSYPATSTPVTDMKGGVGGTLTNGPTFINQNNGYWRFDGSNDYLLLNNGNYSITLGNGDTNWTVNIWMRTTTTSNGLASNGDLLSNTNGGPIYGAFSVNGGKQTYWAYPSNINSWKQFQGTKTVNDGVWHMLTWVNNSNYTMDLYVDGAYDITVSPVNVANNNPMDIIGGGLGFISFNGDIGSVQINKGSAFSRSQVLQQFNATFQKYK